MKELYSVANEQGEQGSLSQELRLSMRMHFMNGKVSNLSLYKLITALQLLQILQVTCVFRCVAAQIEV